MKTVSLSEAYKNFQNIMNDIASGKEFAIKNNENEEMFAVIIPYKIWNQTQNRKLGTLQEKGTVIFEKDFYMIYDKLIFACCRVLSGDSILVTPIDFEYFVKLFHC